MNIDSIGEITMNKKELVRNISLAFFLMLVTIVAIRHFIYEGGLEGTASIDAICPFGGLESLYTYLMTGNMVARVMISSFIVLGALIATAVLFRKAFCGYICPFGTIQEYIGKLRKKLGVKEIKVPQKIDGYLRYLKYAVLAWVIIGSAYFGTLVFRNYDPFITFFHFGKGLFWGVEEADLTVPIIAFLVTITVLLASFFIERFWCKYLCPLGGSLTFLTRFSVFNIQRNKDTCTDCKVCDKVCPTNVVVSTADKVTDAECISCMKCVNACAYNSLEIVSAGEKIASVTNAVTKSVTSAKKEKKADSKMNLGEKK